MKKRPSTRKLTILTNYPWLSMGTCSICKLKILLSLSILLSPLLYVISQQDIIQKLGPCTNVKVVKGLNWPLFHKVFSLHRYIFFSSISSRKKKFKFSMDYLKILCTISHYNKVTKYKLWVGTKCKRGMDLCHSHTWRLSLQGGVQNGEQWNEVESGSVVGCGQDWIQI